MRSKTEPHDTSVITTRRGGTKTFALAAVFMVIVVVGAVVYRTISGSGGLSGFLNEDLPTYIGKQIVGVGNSYLEPAFEFEGVTYTAPYTVTMTGVALVATDGTRVIETDTMTVVLGAIPKIGEPIVIEEARFKSGAIRMIQSGGSAGSGDGGQNGGRNGGQDGGQEGGGFIGFDPFVKPGVVDEDADSEVDEPFQLSTVLDLRRLVLDDIDVVYDDGSGADPLRIDALTTTLDIVPEADDAGWYDIALEGGRDPGLVINAAGRVNVDTSVLEFQDGTLLRATLDEGARSSLPGSLRAILEQTNARGIAEIDLTGTLPLADPLGGNLTATVTGEDVSVLLGAYRVPAEALRVDAVLNARQLNVSQLRFETLEGTVDAVASADLSSQAMPGTAEWTVSNLRIQQFLASTEATADGTPPLDGRVNSSGNARFEIAGDALAGTGDLAVRDGSLMTIPMLGAVRDVLDVGGSGDQVGKHKLDATFGLQPGAINLTQSELTTGVMAVRATGTIGFDGALNLKANGGPMEKVQSMLGGIGDLVGAVTDRLVTYRVRGTIDEPKVSVAPLGIGD